MLNVNPGKGCGKNRWKNDSTRAFAPAIDGSIINMDKLGKMTIY